MWRRITEECSDNVSTWWQSTTVQNSLWFYERHTPNVHANGEVSKRPLRWKAVNYVTVEPTASVTTEIFLQSTRYLQTNWLSISQPETSWLQYIERQTRREPHGDEILKWIFRMYADDEQIFTEETVGLYRCAITFGGTIALLSGIMTTLIYVINKRIYVFRHALGLGMDLPGQQGYISPGT